MKRLITILLLIGFSHLILADEPPSWHEFSVMSSNNLFRADIEFNKSDSVLEPRNRKWTIKISEIKSNTSINWSSDFYHNGYGYGELSDDGQIYVYVNDWLEMEESSDQVIIYTKEKQSDLVEKI